MPKLLTRLTAPLLLVVGTLAMTFDLTVPSFWQDEAATIAGANRPISQLVVMAQQIDVVHSFYYGLMHFWAGAFGFSVFSMRLPSAMAVGATMALLYLLVKKLNGNTSLAIFASLIYLALPRTHFASSETRSNALTATLAVALTLALVYAVQEKTRPLLAWAGYAAIAALSTWVFMFSALMLVPHAIYLLVKNRKAIWYFGGAWLLALVAASPVIYWGYHEKNQVNWIKIRPILEYLGISFVGVNFLDRPWLAWIVLLLAAIACFMYLRNKKLKRESDHLTALAFLWSVTPPVLLIAASFVLKPYFVDHYLTFTTPAMAIAASAGLHQIKLKKLNAIWVKLLVGVLILVLGFFSLQQSRGIYSKGGAWFPIVEQIAKQTKPGDAILLPDWRTRNSAEIQIMFDAYRINYLPGRTDLTLTTPPEKSNKLFGIHVKEKLAPQPIKLPNKIALITDVIDKVPVFEQIPNWIGANYKIDRVQSFNEANVTYFKLK